MKPLEFKPRCPVETYEYQMVDRLRAKGRGWQDIAAAIGRSVVDTRRIHDPVLPVIVPPSLEPPRPPVPALVVMAKSPTMDRIMAKVLAEYCVTREEIVSLNRRASILHARQAFCALAHEAGKSYPNIGAYLGRHHSVILHAANQHRARMAEMMAA